MESSLNMPRVDVAICTGHNHSIPPCIVSWLKGAKLVLIEDVYRISGGSRSIRILSPISTMVALHWPQQSHLYKRGIVVGPIYEEPKYKPWDGGYILVTTGSYGYERLFDIISELRHKWRIILQTGRINPNKYKTMGLEAFRFDPDIDKWIAGASIVITHIGVTAINAALGYGKPVIMVYNPKWIQAAPPQDAEIVAKMLNIVFLWRINRDILSKAIEEAFFKKPPRIPSSSKRLASLILKLLDQ